MCVYAHTQVYIHTYMHACIHTCMHACIHTHTIPASHLCFHFPPWHIHTYICIYRYIHTYMHTYIHTHTHTQYLHHIYAAISRHGANLLCGFFSAWYTPARNDSVIPPMLPQPLDYSLPDSSISALCVCVCV